MALCPAERKKRDTHTHTHTLTHARSLKKDRQKPFRSEAMHEGVRAECLHTTWGGLAQLDLMQCFSPPWLCTCSCLNSHVTQLADHRAS